MARAGYRCQQCGVLATPGERRFMDGEWVAVGGIRLQVDHVVPIARGGTNVLGNLQALCGPCNNAKGARL